MKEEWLDVPGYEGYYRVSNLGRVQSVARVIRAPRGPIRIYPRILKGRANRDGYLAVALRKDCKGQNWRIHRLVLDAFVGPCPAGFEACHNDGDPSNCALSNLRWDTHSRNVLDAVRHGTNANAAKLYCAAGHPFDATNTYISIPHHRGCRICRREADLRYKERKRAAA